MTTRRQFLKTAGALGAAMFVPAPGLFVRRAFAEIPGGTLSGLEIPKYQMPLVIPPAMPKAGKIKGKGGKDIDYYEIAVRQFQQQILPPGLPATTVWSYGAPQYPGTVFEGGSYHSIQRSRWRPNTTRR